MFLLLFFNQMKANLELELKNMTMNYEQEKNRLEEAIVKLRAKQKDLIVSNEEANQEILRGLYLSPSQTRFHDPVPLYWSMSDWLPMSDWVTHEWLGYPWVIVTHNLLATHEFFVTRRQTDYWYHNFDHCQIKS